MWFDQYSRVFHIQEILLSDLVPVEYAYFCAHHSIVLRNYERMGIVEAQRASAKLLLDNSGWRPKLRDFLRKGTVWITFRDSGLEAILKGEIEKVIETLKSIRFRFSLEKTRYITSESEIAGVLEALERIFAHGIGADNPLMRYYYTAQIMLKVAKYHAKMFLEGKGKRSVQVIVMDSLG